MLNCHADVPGIKLENLTKMRKLAELQLLEGERMNARIIQLVRRRGIGEIDDAVFAALYFLNWQMAMHGGRCAVRKYKRDPRPNPDAWWEELRDLDSERIRARLLHYLENYGFWGVIANVPATFCEWLRGRWSITLCEFIPGPEAVLDMQAAGTRPVTILWEYPRLFQPVLRKANAYAFMVHDLEHAYKYFHDATLHCGQKSFFVAISQLLHRGVFDSYRRDTLFSDKFVYLISDMNTHVMHSMHYLRAILIEYQLRRELKPPEGILSTEARGEINGIMQAMSALLPIHFKQSVDLCLTSL